MAVAGQMQDYNLIIQLPRHFTGLVPSIYLIDRPFDIYGYCTKISLDALPLDALNLCVLRGIVLLRKYAHKPYTYIPPPVQRGYRKLLVGCYLSCIVNYLRTTYHVQHEA
jgi:hypothetical protein